MKTFSFRKKEKKKPQPENKYQSNRTAPIVDINVNVYADKRKMLHHRLHVFYVAPLVVCILLSHNDHVVVVVL